MSGRKGAGVFKFQGLPLDRKMADMTDRPGIAEARQMAKELTTPFLAGEVDRVLIVWPQFVTLGRQPPSEMQLVPIPRPEAAPDGGSDGEEEIPFLFEPNAEEIFEELLPLYVENMVFRVLAESVVGEMIARRIAMKLATENADKLVKSLTLQFNRARQAQITMELADILGGSEALK